MAPTLPLSNDAPTVGPFRDGDRTVIALQGEHDLSTVDPVIETLAEAIAMDDADVAVDLSGVEFMDASTVAVLLRCHRLLALRSRTLTFRAPSRSAHRVLDMCGLANLVDSPPGEGTDTTASHPLRLVDTANPEPQWSTPARQPDPASIPLTG